MKQVFETEKFLRDGNNLSVDFVNTRIAENGVPLDLLKDFTDFAAWAIAAGLLEKSQAEKLIGDSKNRLQIAEAFARAINFREILREMFENLADGKEIGEAAMAAINRELQNTGGSIEVRKAENGFEKLFRADFSEPRRLLAPIAESAADLLCYGVPAQIKKCENPDCVLFFYDTTKNHSRRWCSMQICGNRAKAAAFYQRGKMKTSGKTNKLKS